MHKTLLLILIATWLHAAAYGAAVYRIACGSSSTVTDATGSAWQADAFFTGGTAYTTPAMAALDGPYRSLRYSASKITYTIPLDNGTYRIRLSFLENRTASSVPPVGAGQRRFTVTAAGLPLTQASPVIPTSLDLYATAGSLHPLLITADVVVDSGQLVIDITPELGNAVISGIEIDSLNDPGPNLIVVTYLAGLESAPPACPVAGLTLFLAVDTNHLFWCVASGSNGKWNTIGDGPAIGINIPAK